RVDIVIGTSPHFFTACAAYMVSRAKRIPFVFELRDLWPESIRAVGAMQNSAWLDRLERLEMFLYRKADRIVSVTESFKRNLVDRGVDANKIDVITNGVDTNRFHPCPRDETLASELGVTGKFLAGYIGTHGMAHGLETLLEAAARLQDDPEASDVRILFMGDGARKAALIERADAMQLNNVVFVDSVPKDQVIRYMSLLDVSIIHLRKTALFTSVIPSKLFENMGMGIPVLHGVAGESADIVQRTGCGEVFEPENVDELVAGLKRMRSSEDLRQQYRDNGLKAACQYDRQTLALEMLRVLEGCASSGA
ncbi:MAG: glycosyltransferase family 4 protein, partial [Pseudomonadales bacterium]